MIVSSSFDSVGVMAGNVASILRHRPGIIRVIGTAYWWAKMPFFITLHLQRRGIEEQCARKLNRWIMKLKKKTPPMIFTTWYCDHLFFWSCNGDWEGTIFGKRETGKNGIANHVRSHMIHKVVEFVRCLIQLCTVQYPLRSYQLRWYLLLYILILIILSFSHHLHV